jgi:hypothetical protein
VSNPDLDLLEAVDLAQGGDWGAAHKIVQDREGDAMASWIHAVVHRMEGDRGNAGYWYDRCGRPFPDDLSTAAELQEIREALSL